MTQAAILAASGSPGTTTGFKNRIINGGMQIWQRGTSYTPGSYYTYGAADRWCNNSLNTAYAQSSDVPSGFLYSYSITGSSAAYPGTTQRIESFNTTDLVGQSVTVSAYIKKTTGNTAINATLFYASTKDNFGTLVSIGDVTLTSSPTSSWVRYTGTFNNLPAGAANGIQLSIYTVSGSSSDVMLITGVQLEVGTTATNFDFRSYGTELQLCQRYYEVHGGTANCFPQYFGYGNNGTNVGLAIPFAVSKRAAPTVTALGTWTVSNCGQPFADSATIQGYRLAATCSSTNTIQFYPASSSEKVTISAEL